MPYPGQFTSIYAKIRDSMNNPEYSVHRSGYSANAVRTEDMELILHKITTSNHAAFGR